MSKKIRLNKSLPEAVFERLLQTSKKHTWLRRRDEKLNYLLESCSSEVEQLFLCDILDRFTYINGENLADSLEKIGQKIVSDWGCTPDDTVIVAMDRSRFADSSAAIAWMIKPVLADLGDWETQKIYKNLTDAINDAKTGQKFVIVDEFVGSGETLSKRLRWIKSKFDEEEKNVDIYVATVAAMEICKRRDFSTANEFYSTVWMKQGLSDFYSGSDLTEAVSVMLKMEEMLLPEYNFLKISKYSLGYKKTQSTYYLENGNPPNNNFPIFWWKMTKSGERRNPLLPRV